MPACWHTVVKECVCSVLWAEESCGILSTAKQLEFYSFPRKAMKLLEHGSDLAFEDTHTQHLQRTTRSQSHSTSNDQNPEPHPLSRFDQPNSNIPRRRTIVLIFHGKMDRFELEHRTGDTTTHASSSQPKAELRHVVYDNEHTDSPPSILHRPLRQRSVRRTTIACVAGRR
jgi:hypothetical protein